MLVLCVIVALFSLGTATITKFDRIPIHGAGVIYQGFYMFDKRLSIPKSSSSYIELLVGISKENPSWDAQGVIQGAVLSKEAFEAMGYVRNNTKYFCCDKIAIQRGICEEEQTLILPKKYKGDGQKRYLSTRLVIPKEGLYYYLIGSCKLDTTNVALSGYSVTMNPYGHLPATLYGVYPFTKILIWLYLFVFCYWMFRCWKYSQSLLFIHYLISLVLISFLLSLFFFNFHLHTINRLGTANSVVSFLSTLSMSLSRGAVRILLLYIALGSGSVHNEIRVSPSAAVFLVLLYTLFKTSVTLNQETQSPLSLASTAIPVMIETVISIAIFSFAMETVRKLEKEQQTTKLSSFYALFSAMGVLFVLSLAFNVLLLNADLERIFDRFWKLQWIATYGQWEILLFILNVVVVVWIEVLWSPVENAEKYVSHIQLATDENVGVDVDVEGKEEMVMTLDKNEEANTMVNCVKDEAFKPMTIVQ
ncbi:uncharacterized protein [Blastocystis hominis]|uniref:GOST seven transmembrane domain-containing protein n=1 Tax=Blastocystis hominis TaxID=12968 RepID=D8M0H7_BLAHO|nr:uncharacterized protein [Blastocystis hominis]CBK21566.2 unnamed protein product [Blastocystis hominis]|eukprot:XP_012895614.1 uncharacterized protein [Blastocystis hominis]